MVFSGVPGIGRCMFMVTMVFGLLCSPMPMPMSSCCAMCTSTVEKNHETVRLLSRLFAAGQTMCLMFLPLGFGMYTLYCSSVDFGARSLAFEWVLKNSNSTLRGINLLVGFSMWTFNCSSVDILALSRFHVFEWVLKFKFRN